MKTSQPQHLVVDKK